MIAFKWWHVINGPIESPTLRIWDQVKGIPLVNLTITSSPSEPAGYLTFLLVKPIQLNPNTQYIMSSDIDQSFAQYTITENPFNSIDFSVRRTLYINTKGSMPTTELYGNTYHVMWFDIITRDPLPSCICNSGTFGTICNQTFCDSNPCIHGTCTSLASNYTCSCDSNWYGPQCSLSGCSSNPCQNNATCSASSATDYSCQCSVGYFNKNCTQNYCDNVDCNHHGTCLANSISYNCNCDLGFSGGSCLIDVCLIDDGTDSGNLISGCNEGQGNGVCIRDSTSAYHCACNLFYSGDECQTYEYIDSCAEKDCNNNGICSNKENEIGYICSCNEFSEGN
jgi:hypothetical protein